MTDENMRLCLFQKKKREIVKRGENGGLVVAADGNKREGVKVKQKK
jgi:hypothetical protein